jgi:RNA polymerase sigma factor (sigma-70 family)
MQGEFVDLVVRAQNGDSNAWGELYSHFKPILRDLTLRQSRGKVDPDDVVQDAFVVAIRKICQLKDPMSFPSWIKSICHHLTTNAFNRRPPFISLCTICKDVVHDNRKLPDPADQVADREIAGVIRREIEAMPKTARSTAEAFYLHGLSYPQIARLLRIPQGTVKSRLNRVRSILASRIRPLLLDTLCD